MKTLKQHLGRELTASDIKLADRKVIATSGKIIFKNGLEAPKNIREYNKNNFGSTTITNEKYQNTSKNENLYVEYNFIEKSFDSKGKLKEIKNGISRRFNNNERKLVAINKLKIYNPAGSWIGRRVN